MTQCINVQQAIEALQRGELVAFPTETVYGLGADATNLEAIKRLYAVKKRPLNHPVITHIATVEQLNNIAIQIPDNFQDLAKHFWPGPLTVLLQKHPNILEQVTGGQNTIAVRIPNHPVALALLTSYGKPLVAPSANKFGRISPTTAQHVLSEFGDEIAGVLDGGPCEVGIESTILDLSQQGQVQILRPGMITADDLQPYFTFPITAPYQYNAPLPQQVSGSYPSHYAPTKPTYLINTQDIARITQTADIGLLAFTSLALSKKNWIQTSNTPKKYAQDLYQLLRALDTASDVKTILIEALPYQPEWDGLRDRIQKACAGKWFEI